MSMDTNVVSRDMLDKLDNIMNVISNLLLFCAEISVTTDTTCCY